jgi:hypothetical protein
MADASDSKSDVGDYVWVQVPSPAFEKPRLFEAFLCLAILFCIRYNGRNEVAGARYEL